MRARLLVLLCALTLHTASAQTRPATTGVPATNAGAPSSPLAIPAGATVQLIGTYSLERLQRIVSDELDQFMSNSSMPTEFRGRLASPRYAVNLYKVNYRSVVPEIQNMPTRASGLIAVPVTEQRTLPLVSYQHGTVFDRSWVPSNPDASIETRLIIAQFAAQGYLVIGADYFGRGDSTLPDSYLVRDSTRQAGQDLYFNVLDFLGTRGISVSHFFLSGWSQGGWVTMQYLHELESRGVKVTAAAAASAPVDIFLTINRWLNNPQPVDAAYLPGVMALHLFAQERYNNLQGLSAVAIRAPYLQAAQALYESRLDWTEFAKQTPPKVADFLNPEFMRSGFVGRTPYWRGIDQEQAYRWRIVTPLRVYYGGNDEVTPAYVGLLPERTQTLVGGISTQTVYAGDRADHRAVFIHGMIDQKPWFDSLRGVAAPTR